MAQRDLIEEFMRNYGRLYDRLEPRDQEFVRTTLDEEMEQLRGRSFGDEPEPSLKSAVEHDFQVWKEMMAERQADKSMQQDRRESRLTAAEAVEEGMWEENETERTAYRFWKPERTTEAGEPPLEFPTDYRLDALVPWEPGTSQLDEGIQVYEMTGHEWLKPGDIVTTPEGQGYVIAPPSRENDPSPNAPDFSWGGSYSETIAVPNLAAAQSRDTPDPAREIRAEFMSSVGHGDEKLAQAEEEKIIINEFVEPFHERQGRETDGFVERPAWDEASREASLPTLVEQDFNLRETNMAEKNPSRETLDSIRGRSDAEIVNTQGLNLARDPSRDMPDPAQALPEADKAKLLERDADVVEQKESVEKRWLAEVKDRAEQSMYTGRGKTDELSVSSAGQYSTNFREQVRPGKTQADLENAVEKMGIGPARDRQQQAQEKATQKEADKGQDQGMEAGR